MASSGLQTFHDREAVLLAPYAMFSRLSQGRKHTESEHPYRGPFRKDTPDIAAAYAADTDRAITDLANAGYELLLYKVLF